MGCTRGVGVALVTFRSKASASYVRERITVILDPAQSFTGSGHPRSPPVLYQGSVRQGENILELPCFFDAAIAFGCFASGIDVVQVEPTSNYD